MPCMPGRSLGNRILALLTPCQPMSPLAHRRPRPLEISRQLPRPTNFSKTLTARPVRAAQQKSPQEPAAKEPAAGDLSGEYRQAARRKESS